MSISETVDRCELCPIGQECPFCGLTGEARRVFQSLAEVRTCTPGTYLLRQGELPEGLFVVRSGVVRLRHDGRDGRCSFLGLVGAAGLLGLVESVNHGAAAMSAEVVRQATVELIPQRELAHFLVRYPQAAVPLLIYESEELEELRDELLGRHRPDPLPRRLLDRLQGLAGICGVPLDDGGVLIDLPLTVQAVGDTLGCSRQWASRLLGEAERAGLVERRDRRILLTPEGLESPQN